MTMKEVQKTIGWNLRRLREDNDYTLKEVAEKIGYKLGRVHTAETARYCVSLKYLCDACDFFGVEVIDLFKGNEE